MVYMLERYPLDVFIHFVRTYLRFIIIFIIIAVRLLFFDAAIVNDKKWREKTTIQKQHVIVYGLE